MMRTIAALLAGFALVSFGARAEDKPAEAKAEKKTDAKAEKKADAKAEKKDKKAKSKKAKKADSAAKNDTAAPK